MAKKQKQLQGRVPIAIGTADWHATETAWSHSKITGDSLYAVEQIVDLAHRHQVPILAAGDLFDVNRPPSHIIAEVQVQMERMRVAGLPVYFITGQHEKARVPIAGEPVEWLHAVANPWPIAIHRTAVSLPGGITAYGINWTPALRLPDELAAIPEGVDILVAHQIWEQLRSGDMITPEASLNDIPAHVRHVLTGDWHVHSTIERRRPYSDVITAWSPGSSSLMDLSESPAKFVFVIHDDLSADSVPLLSRPVIRDMVDAESFPHYLANVMSVVTASTASCLTIPPFNPRFAVPILDVRYADDVFNCKARIEAVVGAAAHVRDRPMPRLKAGAEVGAASRRQVSFAEAAKELQQPDEAVDLAIALYEAVDNDFVALNQVKNEFFERNEL